MSTKYVHTNIVTSDWKKLARFYEKVFGCKPVSSERNLEGKWIDDATGISGVQIKGIHLTLPGYEENGPTLEIFEYNQVEKSSKNRINQPGFAHIAFTVENVQDMLVSVIKEGGYKIGEIVTKEIENAGTIEFVYASDPDGNVLELQHWLAKE